MNARGDAGVPGGMTHPLAIGVDIGGTRIKAGLVDEHGHVVHAVRRDTPGRTTAPDVVEDTLVEVVDGLLVRPEARDRGVVGVGIGAAGFVSADRGTVVFAPHLSWRDEPVQDKLGARIAVPVRVDNDANVALLGELRHGSARGASQVVLVTLGTGIGGAMVLDGVLRRGSHGLAGEFGHMTVVPDGLACPCGNRGCWEQYASGSVLRREGRALLEAGGTPAARLLTLSGGDPDLLEGEHVTRAAQQGDPSAMAVVADVGRWLGAGLANLVAALDPEVVVVGGGASEAGELLLGPAREVLAERLPGRGHRPVPAVRAAALGAAAGMVGAAGLVRAEVVGGLGGGADGARG